MIDPISFQKEAQNLSKRNNTHNNTTIIIIMSSELEKKFAARATGGEGGGLQSPDVFNPNIEFPEFTRKQLKAYKDMFKKYDTDGSNSISFEELKRMMEKLGNPQTHISLRGMINEVDEDGDGEISYREFLLIFRKAAAGELADSPFATLVQTANEIDVQEVGVTGAKSFFEAKADKLRQSNAAEEEIKKEQDEKRKEREAKAARASEFKQKLAAFNK